MTLKEALVKKYGRLVGGRIYHCFLLYAQAFKKCLNDEQLRLFKEIFGE